MAGVKIGTGKNGRLQVRKERKDGFTEAKRQVFLDHLAGCCTVKTAAAAAGVSAVTVNYHRRSDPSFDAQCEAALEIGYGNLDAALVARAARGGDYEPGPDAEAAPGPESVDTMLALHLLQLRHKAPGRRTGQAGRAPGRVSEKALNDSILAKLEVLERRLKQKKKGSPSTGSGRSGGSGALKRHEVRKLKSPEGSGGG